MEESEILELQFRLAAIYREIKTMPLDEYVEKLMTSLTIAPFIDPTLFMKQGKKAEQTLEIFKAFVRLRDTIDKGLTDSRETN